MCPEVAFITTGATYTIDLRKVVKICICTSLWIPFDVLNQTNTIFLSRSPFNDVFQINCWSPSVTHAKRSSPCTGALRHNPLQSTIVSFKALLCYRQKDSVLLFLTAQYYRSEQVARITCPFQVASTCANY